MKNILILLFSLLFLSCCNEVETKVDELTEVKLLIIDEYLKYDGKYFSDRENCLFEHFVKNEIRDLEFDHFVESIGIKYFYCPYNQFNFVLLRSDNKFYYYGLSDFYAYRYLLESKYEKIDDMYRSKTDFSGIYEYRSKTDSLELYEDINERGISLLNEIINTNEKIKRLSERSKHDPDLHNIYALIYYINHLKPGKTNLIYKPIYIDLSYNYKEELLNLKSTTVKNDKVYQLILKNYDNPGGLINISKQTYFLKHEYLGIFIYDIIRENGVIKIERKFIPEKKLPEIISGYDIPSGYGDCNE